MSASKMQKRVEKLGKGNNIRQINLLPSLEINLKRHRSISPKRKKGKKYYYLNNKYISVKEKLSGIRQQNF